MREERFVYSVRLIEILTVTQIALVNRYLTPLRRWDIHINLLPIELRALTFYIVAFPFWLTITDKVVAA